MTMGGLLSDVLVVAAGAGPEPVATLGENLKNALVVTAVGMGITFAAIVVLWWLMAAAVRLPMPAEAAEDEGADAGPAPAPAAEPETEPEGDLRPQAAAAAVAVALALADEAPHPLQAPPVTHVSPWQLSTRTRHLVEKGRRRK